jgi:hypothetical protein
MSTRRRALDCRADHLPCANEFHYTTTFEVIVLRIDVKEADRLDLLSTWVMADGANIMHPQASTVVGLVRQAVLQSVVSDSTENWSARALT